MKTTTTLSLLALLALSNARPTAFQKREVPQEHSHEKFLTSVRTSLNLDNPDGIADPVFGLLGNGAAAAGAGKITNLDCLHQATADRAFTNAKAAGDVQAQADALIFAALERNTGGVGVKSVLCTDAAVNPEIQAISQHQDPASTDAAATNKAITLELAKQLNSIGADPQLALQAGTFAPGDLGDATGAGNTCDDLNDPEGCIFTKNLLVEDATAEEITAAVGGAAAGGDAATPPAAETSAEAPAATEAPAVGDDGAACPAVTTVTVDPPAATAAPAVGDDGAACPAVTTVTVDPPAATQAPAVGENRAACPAATTVTVDAPAATAAPEAAAPPAAEAPAAEAPTATTNVQTFTGSLGGPPPPVESSAGDRPFSVNGNTFVNAAAALQRSCAIQNNACANAVNSKALSLPGGVSDCNKQEGECNAAAKA